MGGVARWCQVRAHGVVCGHFQRLHHALQPVAQALGAEPFAKALHHQRQGKGRGALQRVHGQLLALHALQGLGQAVHVQFLHQQFGPGLGQQQVVRVVLREHVVVEGRRGLQLPAAALLARVALEDEPRNPCNFAKAPARHFGGVQAGQHFGLQSFPHGAVRGLANQVRQQRGPVHRLGRQQLQPVVVNSDGKRVGHLLRRAPRQQPRQPQVHQPPGQRVQVQVPALARVQHLGHQAAGRGQGRPCVLQRQQGLRAAHFGRCEHAALGLLQLAQHGIGQRVRQRHAPAVPARQRGAAFGGGAHIGRHLLRAHQLQQAAGKHEHIAGFEACDEALFHRAQLPAAHKLHLHARVAHDGADVAAVAPRQPCIGHAPHAVFVRHHAMEVGVVGQRCAALAHKLQRPLPLVVGQGGVGWGAAHLGQQGIGHKTAAQGDGHQVLYQHIQRRAGRVAVFNAAFGQRLAGSGSLHQFQAVRGHQRDAAGAPRRVAGSARALHQPRHALGRADLQHLLHRQKVHAQVQAGRAHHRLQHASLEPCLDPAAHLAAERAVVQGNGARPVGPRLQQRLVPALGLRAGVGEEKCCTTPRMPVATCHRPTSRRCSPCQYLRYWRRTAPCAVGRRRRAIFGIRRVLQHQRRRVGLDGLHHLRQQRQAHVPGPGKALHAFGQ